VFQHRRHHVLDIETLVALPQPSRRQGFF